MEEGSVKKRELEAIVAHQAEELAALRRRVEALEARTTIAVTPSERVPVPGPNPWRPLMPYEVEPPEGTGTRCRG